MQEDDAGSEWPSPQLVHSSVAPVENSFVRHSSTPERSLLTLVPAAFVEQYAAPGAEYSPTPMQASQPASPEAPFALNVPAGHSLSSAPSQK